MYPVMNILVKTENKLFLKLERIVTSSKVYEYLCSRPSFKVKNTVVTIHAHWVVGLTGAKSSVVFLSLASFISYAWFYLTCENTSTEETISVNEGG